MFELLLLVSILFLIFLAYKELYPLARKYLNYRKEREGLIKKYNRLWKSRKDMLVIITLRINN